MAGGRRLWLRPWQDVRAAARAVNESALALDAALRMIAARGIRQVVLLGDYTDEGQAMMTARLTARLAHWQTRAGMRFHALPGNHDMWGIAGKHTATRIAAAPGRSVLATSDPALAAHDPGARPLPGLRCPGQGDALRAMAGFGYVRRSGDLHWETPFGPDDRPEARQIVMQAGDGVAQSVIDASYLVEPAPDLWLLMLDANLWRPRPGITDGRRKRAFLDPADADWDAVAVLRPGLMAWIADVAGRAAAQGKTLIALSHYPLLDPFGDDRGMGRRGPQGAAAAAMIAAGVTHHASGHLHTSAVTQLETAQGALTDIAVPSPCAWPPGFTILHPGPDGVRAEAVSLADVRLTPGVAEFYRAEGAGDPGTTLGQLLEHQARARAAGRAMRRGGDPSAAAAAHVERQGGNLWPSPSG